MESPKQSLLIDTNGTNHSSIEEGPSSPFHAMEEEGQGIAMVNTGIPTPTLTSTNDTIGEENDLKVYQGYADFDDEDIQMNQISSSKWYFGKTKRATIKILYLAIFSAVGALLRIVLAQLFGEECKNPGTVGYLRAGQPLCVTANGETSIEGGIIFSDLPGNLLGAMIMGLLLSTDAMSLPKTFPIAWLNENSHFQTFDTIHFAIKTGLCGSLTTFSSWNSEMVVMMMVGSDGANNPSLVVRGLLGYLIGVETALASFVLGKNIAKYFYGVNNKPLQREHEQAVLKRECGVYINYQLSDYERRFLSEFKMGEYEQYIDPVATEQLALWRNSTRENRRVGNQMLPLLTDIEYMSLVLDEPIDNQELIMPALTANWDLDALNTWRQMKKETSIVVKRIEPREFRFAPAIRIFLLVFGLIVAGVVMINDNYDDYSVTYRTMLYSALLAPIGATVRYKFSHWNGKWTRFSWFPLGTFAANLLASVISVSMIAIEFRMNGGDFSFWRLGSVRAIKIGFAGCLSTVSTFISEFWTLLNSEHPIHGYLYVLVTLFCCSSMAAVSYLIVTHGHDPGDYYNAGYGY